MRKVGSESESKKKKKLGPGSSTVWLQLVCRHFKVSLADSYDDHACGAAKIPMIGEGRYFMLSIQPVLKDPKPSLFFSIISLIFLQLHILSQL